VGQDKQGRHKWKRAGGGLILTRGRGQEGHIHKVLQEVAAQVCIKCTFAFCVRTKDWDVVSYPLNSSSVLYNVFLHSLYNSFSCLIVIFLCRLKMNNDSHEFILDFGTDANSNIFSRKSNTRSRLY
jgi:hypothetical protein